MRGKCKKGDECNYWHPKPCKFYHSGTCTEGKKCSFLHSKDSSSAAAEKQQESASGTKDENQTSEAKPKGKAKAKNKPAAKVLLHVDAPSDTCMSTIKSKEVRFSKLSQKKAVRDNKLGPTTKRWDLRHNLSDFKPKISNPDGSINWPENWQEHVEWFEAWSRRKAILLWDEIYPDNKADWDTFFQWHDNDRLRKLVILNEGSLLGNGPGDEWKTDWIPRLGPSAWGKARTSVEATAKPKVTKKDASEAKKREGGNLKQSHPPILRSALKGKRNLSCFDDADARTYIIDSGSSFHVVSRSDMTERELRTITRLRKPIEILTANGQLELTETCQIYVKDLKVQLRAYILEDTVALLSLGLLVEEHGFSLIWTPGCSPVLCKDEITVHCHPINNVPHIYLGAFVEDALNNERIRPKGHEHPGTAADKVDGQPKINKSSKGNGRESGRGSGPNAATLLA